MSASGAALHDETALRRDGKVISLIGLGHFASHFYQLSLPALIPLIHRGEGTSYTQLGLLVTLFFLASGVFQTPAGFLVDRIGARPVLIGGLVLLAGGIALMGVAPSYPVLAALAFLAGLGNSIFHPADFSILTASVADGRHGRAFSIHYFGGFIGYAAAPVAMVALGTLIGWREALIVVGLPGLAIAFFLWLWRHELRDDRDAGRAPMHDKATASLRRDLVVLIRPQTIFCFLFFAFTAAGSVGVMTLGASALIGLLALPATLASSAITANLTGAICGILIGGWIADRTKRHDFTASLAVTGCVSLLLLLPLLRPSEVTLLFPLMTTAGIFYGLALPLRDMVVRAIAPKGAAGKVFGFTYSGMDFGSSLAGILFGMMLDRNAADWFFVSVGLFMMIGVALILAARAVAQREPAAHAA